MTFSLESVQMFPSRTEFGSAALTSMRSSNCNDVVCYFALEARLERQSSNTEAMLLVSADVPVVPVQEAAADALAGNAGLTSPF